MKVLARLASIGLGVLLPSCTLIIDRNAEQCETNDDCAGFPGTTCSEERVCSEPLCATNQECVEQFGEFHVCSAQTHACADMRSTECTVIEGDYEKDDALLIGVVVPTDGEAAQTGKSITNAVRLALSEIATNANGLPPLPGKSMQRPVVLVGCNDKSDADTAAAAGQHLVSLGVPAIIGAAFSGITIKMATEATIPGGTLVISPSATSVAITDLSDQGLVWRTAPSDIYQAEALVQYSARLQEDVRLALGLQAGDKLRVAILHKGDSYGTGLGRVLEAGLVLNGTSALDPQNNGFYRRFDYGDPDNATTSAPRYEEAVQAALDLEPHIIFSLGTRESVLDVLAPIEEGWQLGAYRPRYVLSDGSVIPQLWESVVQGDTDLRHRITGTIPGTSNPRFNAFRGDYIGQFNDGTSPDVFGAAGAYDAAYLLAYSAVALGGEAPTGARLAGALSKMIPPGDPVNVGEQISSTFDALLAGASIDVNGASGALDFDPEDGEAASDIQIWCMPANGAGDAQSVTFSGLYLAGSTSTLVGTLGSVCD
ncbi:ABC transporter substrate-binding protein [Chondromyces apiculatus]|nr:ABC transporter substrate-binding protein [Chondromyces apiculatus]